MTPRYFRDLWTRIRTPLALVDEARQAADEAKMVASKALRELDDHHRLATSVTWQLDSALERFTGSGMIVMSEGDFVRLDSEYSPPDGGPFYASYERRWAYTYKGYPIWTGIGFSGALVLNEAAFAGLRLTLGATLKLRER